MVFLTCIIVRTDLKVRPVAQTEKFWLISVPSLVMKLMKVNLSFPSARKYWEVFELRAQDNKKLSNFDLISAQGAALLYPRRMPFWAQFIHLEAMEEHDHAYP